MRTLAAQSGGLRAYQGAALILRRTWVRSWLLVALIAVTVGVLAWRQTSKDATTSLNSTMDPVIAAQTVGPGPDEEAAAAVVDRFIGALASTDTDTLYDLQTEDYKHACTRDRFRALVAQLGASHLSGPARVAIDGDFAAVRVFSGEDPNRTPVVVPLRRESDGAWRIVAQSSAGCMAQP